MACGLLQGLATGVATASTSSDACSTASTGGAYPGFGGICVVGSNWAPPNVVAADPSFHMDVFSNGKTLGIVGPANTFGYEWQCTELAVRWANAAWGEGGYSSWKAAGWDGAASTMYGVGPKLAHPLQQFPNGSGQAPQPGDLLVFHENTPPGHVAVVLNVNRTTGKLTFIGENQYAAPAIVSVPISTSNVVSSAGFSKSLVVTGWLHNPAWSWNAAPTPPVVRVASRTATSVTLSWTESGSASSFTVLRNGRALGAPTNLLSFTDRKLSPNTFYHYQVVANGSGGLTAASMVTTTGTLQAPHFRIDVNGDGRTDEVYVYAPGDAVVTFLSLGNGQYQEQDFALRAGFDAAGGTWTTGDVNGDGKTDLIYVYAPGDAVVTFLSLGNGQYQEQGFALRAGFDAAGGTWTTGDVNGDGKTDLVYVYPMGTTPYVDSFTSQGNGLFTEYDFALRAGFDAGNGTWMVTTYSSL